MNNIQYIKINIPKLPQIYFDISKKKKTIFAVTGDFL